MKKSEYYSIRNKKIPDKPRFVKDIMEAMDSFKRKAQQLKLETIALYYAYRDPRVPWYARAFILLVVAYAFSPIDLIPDFIPVLGYLDDFVLIPLGVAIALRMIPAAVMDDSRALARSNEAQPVMRWMGAVVVGLWLVVGGAIIWRFVY